MIVHPAVIKAFVRQRLHSPGRLVFLALLFGSPLLGTWFMWQAGLAGLGTAGFMAIVVSAGMIGQDVASGTLQLLLARPVTRPAYVISRWLAATLTVCALVAAQLAIALLLLAVRGGLPDARSVFVYLAQASLEVAGIVAVMTLLSALMHGLGDVFLMFALFVTASVLGSWQRFERLGIELQRVLTPQLPLAGLLAGEPSWFLITSYFSTVTLALGLAIVLVNRKELSYAGTQS
jgi:hypothetical protein